MCQCECHWGGASDKCRGTYSDIGKRAKRQACLVDARAITHGVVDDVDVVAGRERRASQSRTPSVNRTCGTAHGSRSRQRDSCARQSVQAMLWWKQNPQLPNFFHSLGSPTYAASEDKGNLKCALEMAVAATTTRKTASKLKHQVVSNCNAGGQRQYNVVGIRGTHLRRPRWSVEEGDAR